jgi:hypothetical protein
MTRKPWIAAFTLALAIFPQSQASAEETYTEDTESTWGVISSDDGFTKTFTIFKNSSNVGYTDLGTENTYSIEIQCQQKKLNVLVYSDPIGIYPTDDLSGIGYAQVKVDSGKISKHKYVSLKDSSGIGLWTPKVLISSMLKGKRQVAFKIPSSVQADTVANFALGNLSSYVNKFKSLGCPLK